MIIVQKHNTYLVVDGENNVIISAASTADLYAKALEILQAFAEPVHYSVIDASSTQLAADILSNKYTG